MQPIRETIHGDCHLNPKSISIEPADAFFWIERFINNCTSLAKVRDVLEGLEEAIKANKSWDYSYNDTYARYDPSQQVIIADFERSDIFIAPASTIPVTDFVRLLSLWKEALSSSPDHNRVECK